MGTKHKNTPGAALRPNRLAWVVAGMLAGLPASGLAQTPAPLAEQATPQPADQGRDALPAEGQMLEEVVVTGEAENQNIRPGVATGVEQETIQRRNARNVADLLDQTAGVSLNGTYQRPDTSVSVQGIGGMGRVTQSLEGVSQNFYAFDNHFNQTGSMLVESSFLKSVDVQQGAGAGGLGSLAGSVDYQYLDMDDVLRPGKSVGGLLRASSGFSKYRNGQKPAYTGFFGARSDRWDLLVGAADSKQENFRVGTQVPNLSGMHGGTASFFRPGGDSIVYYGSSCEHQGLGSNSVHICPNWDGAELAWKGASKSGPAPGTWRDSDSQMVRLRHYLNDAYDQRLELLATRSSVAYQTDVQTRIRMNSDGSASYERPTQYVNTSMVSSVTSLKYAAHFSDWFNPEVQLYHQSLARKQSWMATEATLAQGILWHHPDTASTGLRLSNTAHLRDQALPLGPLRLDTALELRRSNKTVDSMSEGKWLALNVYHNEPANYDPDSREDTLGLSLALSTAGDGPWQATAGLGWQRQWMDVYDVTLEKGNAMLVNGRPAAINPVYDTGKTFLDHHQYPKHQYDLPSASLGVQWTMPETGFSLHAQAGYGKRAPNSLEMYRNGVYYRNKFTQSTYLEPESNLSLQFGPSYQAQNWLVPNDQLKVAANLYRNRIRNYILMGNKSYSNEVINEQYAIGENGVNPYKMGNGSWGYLNNTRPWITQGLTLELAYKQPLFFVRGNLTVPFKKNNQFCWNEFPGGNGIYSNTVNGQTVYSEAGTGRHVCGNPYKPHLVQEVQPVQGSLTLAATPNQWEFGGTLHYRGKQRSYLYISPGGDTNTVGYAPTEPGSYATYHRYPAVWKLDLFASYRFSDQLSMSVYLANAMDRLDMVPWQEETSLLPGRTLSATVEYRF